MKVGKRILAVASSCVLALCKLAGCQKKASEPAHQDETLEVSDSVQTAKAETEPFYVMVVGNDSRTGTVEIRKPEYSDGTGRSDVLMLVRVDPKTYKVSLISVPRDTCTEYNGQKMKLNEVYHVGGVKELEKEVAKLTGVTPKYYMDMDFVQFEKFVDQLGGVTANVPINMQLVDIVSGDKIALNAGTQELNGPEALVLARSRKQYANDLDACRQIQDRQLVQVGIEQVAADPLNAALHVQALIDNCDTDWATANLIETVKVFAQNADKITFVSGTGPYQGDIDPDINLWLADRDEATWAKIISTVEAGGDPETIVASPNVAAA